MTNVVRCRAPARNARRDGQQCAGFVARVPFPVRVTGILEHSNEAKLTEIVAACVRCGKLHALAPEALPAVS